MTLIRSKTTVRTDGYRYRNPESIRGARYATAQDWNTCRALAANLGVLSPDDVRNTTATFRDLVNAFCEHHRQYWEDPVDELWFRRTCRHGYPASRNLWSPSVDDALDCATLIVAEGDKRPEAGVS